MRNPALQYPGDGGCSWDLCPNRRDARVKRGRMIPLGEMRPFAAGQSVHEDCLRRILVGKSALDAGVDGPYTTDVVAEGGSDE